jgi:hypothetical protein
MSKVSLRPENFPCRKFPCALQKLQKLNTIHQKVNLSWWMAIEKKKHQKVTWSSRPNVHSIGSGQTAASNALNECDTYRLKYLQHACIRPCYTSRRSFQKLIDF